MSKQPRHQSVINRQSDAEYSEDHWLKQFENKLQKTSVQPRGQTLYEQITSIMNTKSKYPSVQAAVDDMMHRSGLSSYLNNVKESQETAPARPKKTAQLAASESSDFEDEGQEEPKKEDPRMPEVIKQKRSVLKTLENIIKDNKGNMSIPAIIARLHSLHARDIPDESAWEDEKLIHLVSKLNLQAKKDNPGNFDNFDMLGKGDHSTADSDIDVSNTDAFNALMPAKI